MKLHITSLITLALTGLLQAQTLTLEKGQCIAYIGNTLADRMQHDGYLETLIHAAHPKHQLTFRNLGFPGDEINKRPRSANFGSPEHWQDHVGAHVIFAFFGYNEALNSDAVSFKKACATLVQQTRGLGRTIVLISPVAHEDLNSPHLPNGVENNIKLAAITRAMAEVSTELNVPYVDVFTPTKAAYANTNEPLTMNGIHLNTKGNALIAEIIANQLFGIETKLEALEPLRQAVLDKNLHWWSRYRTVDGYNVYGGRSKLSWHGQSNFDVMQREMEIFDTMTINRDQRIWALAQGHHHEVDDSNTPPLLEVQTNRPGKQDGGTYTYKSGEDAITDMTVHSKMKVNLFACEKQFPQLINPVQLSVDPNGRLFAAVWPTYPHWNPKMPMNDMLVILPDENHDGKADELIVFADGLNSITGFEFWGGGVLVAAAPELLFLKDTDGDNRADVRINMLQGVSSADSHHTANGLVIGPDGCLYWSRGVFHVTNMETPTKTFRSNASGVYRFDPRTYEINFHFGIGPNPHGNSFDAWGFQYATDGTSGTGDYIAIGNGQRAPHRLYTKRVRPVPASGILGSSHFSSDLQGNFLICNAIGFLGVLNHTFKYDGADITCEEVEPIMFSKDPNFRPADIEVGGDGALYIADWQQALIGHMQHNIRDPNRDHAHGRIYRVVQKGRPLLKHPKMINQPINEVLETFKHPSEAFRYRARIELSGRDGKAATDAANQFAHSLDVKDPIDAQALLECLWVHSEHRIPNIDLAARALHAEEPRIRAAVTRTVGWWLNDVSEGIKLITEAANDNERIVRAEAILAAARAKPNLAAAEVIFIAGSKESDPQIEANLAYATKQLNLNNIVKSTLDGGESLSPAGEKYMVARSDNGTLLKMNRNNLVNNEILQRPGISSAHRWEALNDLAKAAQKSSASILVAAIQNAGERAPVNDWAGMLATMTPKQLTPVRADIARLQASTENGTLRKATTAALINAGESPTALLQTASQSREHLANFLEAVPLITASGNREVLYPDIRKMVMNLPDALKPDKAVMHSNGVQYKYYRKHQNAELANIDRWQPSTEGSFDNFTYRVPNQPMDGFTVRLETWVNLPATGEWTFYVSSDDGSRMYLNGNEIINNDGHHSMTEKSSTPQTLGAGSHQLIVTYFDSGGGDGLQVSWKGPGVQKAEIPPEALKSGGADLLETSLAQALTQVTSRHVDIFSDFVKLLEEGRHTQLAIVTLAKIPENEWPENQLEPLGKALAKYVPETPIESRDSQAFKDSIAFGRRVADKLPVALAQPLRHALSDLDLAVIRIGTIPERMLYTRTQFTVKAGKPVKIILSNPDALPHNLVVVQPGAAEEVAIAAAELAEKGFEKHFIPDHEKILHYTPKLLNKGDSAELAFVAPSTPDRYEYVCTFPGHWMLMRGVMVVVD